MIKAGNWISNKGSAIQISQILHKEGHLLTAEQLKKELEYENRVWKRKTVILLYEAQIRQKEKIGVVK